MSIITCTYRGFREMLSLKETLNRSCRTEKVNFPSIKVIQQKYGRIKNKQKIKQTLNMVINNISKIGALMLAALWTEVHNHLHEQWPRLKRIKLIVIDPVDEDILVCSSRFSFTLFHFCIGGVENVTKLWPCYWRPLRMLKWTPPV